MLEELHMGCLGVHFAITQDEEAALKNLLDDDSRLEFVQEDLEERYLSDCPEWTVQSDKAWDAIHRALTDGELGWDNGSFPLNHVILGGEILYGEDDYIMSLKTPDQVKQIAKALSSVTEAEFRKSYFRIDEDNYGFPVSDEDYDYTWPNFEDVRRFYFRVADTNRYVLFTADQ